MKKIKLIDFSIIGLYFSVCIFYCAGCSINPNTYISKIQRAPGTYHRVEKGQTLWKIAQIYNVDLDALAKINHISDTTNIEIGQLIFIPQYSQTEANLHNKYPIEEFTWPLKGRVITGFGKTINNMVNKGIDIQSSGNLNIIASRSGRVIFYSPYFGDFGKTIIIDHGDGLSSVYTRNSEVFVKTGDNVSKGMTIAKAGSAGRDKNVYLHFEIRKGYIPQNPNFYLPVKDK